MHQGEGYLPIWRVYLYTYLGFFLLRLSQDFFQVELVPLQGVQLLILSNLVFFFGTAISDIRYAFS